MENARLSRQANSAKDDIETAINDLISRIEELEEVVEQKNARIEELENQLEELKQ